MADLRTESSIVSNIDRITPSETNFIVESKEDNYQRKLAELQEVNDLLRKENEDLKTALRTARMERDMWKGTKLKFDDELTALRNDIRKHLRNVDKMEEALVRGRDIQERMVEEVQNPPEEQEWEFP